MPVIQQWVFTDVVSGETVTTSVPGLPDRWVIISGIEHGPRGLYIIAQRLINQVVFGNVTYDEAGTTPYDANSQLDAGYTIPDVLF